MWIHKYHNTYLDGLTKHLTPPISFKGVEFPITEKGDRSTTKTGCKIIAAAIRGAKDGKYEVDKIEKYAVSCEKEKNWRYNYNKHFMRLVEVSLYSKEVKN